MITIKDVKQEEVDLVISPIFKGQQKVADVEKLMESGAFKAEVGECFVMPHIGEKVQYTLYLGLGDQEDFVADDFRCALAKAIQRAKALKVKSVMVPICVSEKLCVGGNIKVITEAMMLGQYHFSHQTIAKEENEIEVYITGVPAEKANRAAQILEETKGVAAGVCLARNLTNEPSNILYPETLADKVIEMAEETGLEVEVLEEKAIADLGMNAFLAVGGSSARKPRLIVMRHRGDKESKEVLGLVGKGLTYDTGGYSLKPTDSMKTMHSDMGGAAAVVGAMYAISRNKVKANIVAVVAACENVIAPDSYKPGDIITSMSGKTIEIGNTDAEGRLTLADAVTYAVQKEKVTKVIDLATLTGAALVALGTSTTAVITNDEVFYGALQEAAKKTGEAFWQLPSTKAYKKLNKSSVADLKNLGGRYAGTITAGLFVGEFVEDLPWMHLDIAGTAWSDENEGYIQKGGTGVPVRTLYTLVGAPCPCHEKNK